METEMNLEKFGEIMGKAITEADAAMLIRMPAGELLRKDLMEE